MAIILLCISIFRFNFTIILIVACTWVVGTSSISVQKVFVIHTRVESTFKYVLLINLKKKLPSNHFATITINIKEIAGTIIINIFKKSLHKLF